VLLAQGKVDQALAAVQPVIDAANKTVSPAPADARAYASAFLVYGQILEAQKKYPAALEAYLTVKTLFYQNQALVDRAAQLVQNLRAEQPGVSVE
jgi:tetratricopeptide (TPR) repeat protein